MPVWSLADYDQLVQIILVSVCRVLKPELGGVAGESATGSSPRSGAWIVERFRSSSAANCR